MRLQGITDGGIRKIVEIGTSRQTDTSLGLRADSPTGLRWFRRLRETDQSLDIVSPTSR